MFPYYTMIIRCFCERVCVSTHNMSANGVNSGAVLKLNGWHVMLRTG